MPPRAKARTRPTPLSDADIADLQERLESGKRPRVVLLVDTALGAAGTSVPIVGFGDPADGEFISVRLRDDVVPFSPAELALPVRGRSAAHSPEPAALPLETGNGERKPARGKAAKPAPAPAAATGAHAAPRLVAVPDAPPELAESAADTAPAAAAEPAAPAKSAPAKAAPAKAATPKAGRRPNRPGGVSVTMRFNGKGWTYESARGGKRTGARPLNLAAVRAFADRLEDTSLRRDMQAAIDVCRDEARTRAETLRAELERVEIELAELDE